MADIGSPQHWLVSPNIEIERKWKDVAIQEKVSRIARYKQDIDDLRKGKILDLECRIAMLEKEVEHLQAKRDSITVEEVQDG